MPNYCYGNLEIIANDELLKRIIERVHGTGDESDNPFDFSKIIPMPDFIYRGSIGDKEIELYGKNNWYDWSIENWGTKWNSCDTKLDGKVFSFLTAWSPCSPVIRELARIFPEARFDYWYEEPGWAFCGREIYEDGILKYELNADFSEIYIYDDCDEEESAKNYDYCEGRDDEKVTYNKKTDVIGEGHYYKREDYDGYVRIIDGEFTERYDTVTTRETVKDTMCWERNEE